MKTKTIDAVLRKKMKAWWKSIEDPKVRNLAERDTIVTGGAIASMLLREPVNDYDVYFSNYKTTVAVAKYYVEVFAKQRKANSGIEVDIRTEEEIDSYGEKRIKIVVSSSGIASDDDSQSQYGYFELNDAPSEAQAYVHEVMDGGTDPEAQGQIEQTFIKAEEKALADEDEAFRPVFLSTNAITLSQKVQLVLRFYGDAEKIHSNYDFIHCTNYWTPDQGVVLNKAALEALLTKELRYVGSKYPLASVIRMRKFIQRQWTINAGQILKMLYQLNQLDLTDIQILEEQLTGVDVAYFQEVLVALKKADTKKIDGAYLLEIIDRMF